MNILIGCLLFKDFTGSEMYVFELAKNLVKTGVSVTVASPYIGGPLTELAVKENINVINFDDLIKSNIDFTVIHAQHTPIVEALIKLYPNTNKVCTIHSEVISLENPIIDKSIKKYIAIRPEIKTHLIKNFGIPKNKIEIIYNPIDETKFFKKEVKDHNSILFVGTIDYLRKNTIYDLVEYSKLINRDLWLVGNNSDNYLNDVLKNKHVKYAKAEQNIERYTQRCNETAGILLGRTTIEGWLCGKSGWIYDVNSKGNILSKNLHNPPEDLHKFYASNVAKKIKEVYINI
jgi:glycosyltransferase involved in cell wall biosynthesis